MKHFVFLTNQYYPVPGATGVCIHQIAKYLVSKGNKVSVICYGTQNKKDVSENIDIYSIKAQSYLFKEKCSSKLLVKINRFRQLFDKLIHIQNYPLRSFSLVRRFVNTAKKILKDDPNVTFIASYTPAEAVYAAAQLKKRFHDVKTVYYSTDSLSDEGGNSGFLSAKYREKKGTRLEQRLFSYFDRILIMECHKEHYFSDRFVQFQPKFFLSNFPLLVKGCVASVDMLEKSKDGEKTLVFAGTFYRKLRNPTFVCNVFEKILKLKPVKIFFLGGGDCQDILETLQRSCPSAVNVLGPQPHDVAERYIQCADILVSVGNVNSPMAPSKIYEYMATGKPILHFYSYEADPCNDPLKKYGNALLVDQQVPVDCKHIVDFINTASNKDTEDVFKIFKTSTPAYTADIIDF